MKQIKLYLGDNMKSLDLLPDNSIDSIVTDPPGMEMDEDYFKICEARINSFEEYRKLLK